jgi:hypothetical protein
MASTISYGRAGCDDTTSAFSNFNWYDLFYQSDYFIEIVGGLDRRVAELALVFIVIVDGYIWVFQGMACEDAGDAVVRGDDAL